MASARTSPHAAGAAMVRVSSLGSRKDDGEEFGRRASKYKTAPAPGTDGTLSSGFRSSNELFSFTCSPENIAPNSLPSEALTYEPPEDVIVTKFQNGDSERKIHCNTELTDLEIEKLQEMRSEAKAKDCSFMPSVASMATRFLSRARNDPRKAVKLMQTTQEWRESYFKSGPVCDDAELIEDMRHGVVYFTGRDLAMRPALVIRAARIPKSWYKDKRTDALIRALIFCMEYLMRFMLVPGKVENLSVIIDLKGLGISQVPISVLSEVYKVMSHHYIGRVFKFYVCNASAVLYTIAGMVKSMLTDRQRQKICVLDNVSELKREFAPHQLEQDLGGSRPVIKQFLPFPLEPGPFALDATAPSTACSSGLHSVLSEEGTRGRLWDPRRTHQDNVRLDYAPGAAAVLKKCGLPWPHEFLLAMPEAPSAVNHPQPDGAVPPAPHSEEDDGSKRGTSKLSSHSTSPGLTDDETCADQCEDEEWKSAGTVKKIVEQDPPELQDTAVGTSGGMFSCRPCWCVSL